MIKFCRSNSEYEGAKNPCARVSKAFEYFEKKNGPILSLFSRHRKMYTQVIKNVLSTDVVLSRSKKNIGLLFMNEKSLASGINNQYC